MFPNNTPSNKTSDNFHAENATKSLDIFSSQMVMNIMDQISEINPSSSNAQDLGAKSTLKYGPEY